MQIEVNFDFSSEKNGQLICERQVSFEEIISAISEGGLLDVLEHPNVKKYPHQKMYVVALNEYIYLVPFVEKEKGVVFLKTIIPSRKAKKSYLKEEASDD